MAKRVELSRERQYFEKRLRHSHQIIDWLIYKLNLNDSAWRGVGRTCDESHKHLQLGFRTAPDIPI